MPWKPRLNANKLKSECDRLTVALARARDDLQISERHRVGLKVMLDTRLERIDKLTVQIDQLRRQNKKLDTECERLAGLFRENTVPAPK